MTDVPRPSSSLRPRRNYLRWVAKALFGAPLARTFAPLLVPLFVAKPAQAQGFNVTGAQLLAMNLKPDGVTLDLARTPDSGASVPMQASISAPAGLKVVGVEVFLPENPNTRALKLRLAEPQSQFVFSTRLRLAASQDVWVVATLSDDSKLGASASTVITASTCFDAS
jgi:predicted secreted protein